jgi:hypothetical protein
VWAVGVRAACSLRQVEALDYAYERQAVTKFDTEGRVHRVRICNDDSLVVPNESSQASEEQVPGSDDDGLDEELMDVDALW